VRRAFRPEFLNRLDTSWCSAARPRRDGPDCRYPADAGQRALAERGLTLLADAPALRPGRIGLDPAFGARPLKRAIQGLVEDPIAERLLDGIGEGVEPAVLQLSMIDGRLALNARSSRRPAARLQGAGTPPIGFALVGPRRRRSAALH